MTNKLEIVRQGDVLLVETLEGIPENAKEIDPINGYFILAYGETTGHAHKIKAEDGMRYFSVNDNKGNPRVYLYVSNPEIPITHEEHGPQTFKEGVKEQGFQYESSDKDEPIPVQD